MIYRHVTEFQSNGEASSFFLQVLHAGPPFPLVVLPVSGDYWQEGTNHACQFDSKGKHIIIPIDPCDLVIEDDVGYCNYKNFFKNQVGIKCAQYSTLSNARLFYSV